MGYGDVYNNEIIPNKLNGKVQSNETERDRYSIKRGDVFFTRTSESKDDIGISSICLSDINDSTTNMDDVLANINTLGELGGKIIDNVTNKISKEIDDIKNAEETAKKAAEDAEQNLKNTEETAKKSAEEAATKQKDAENKCPLVCSGQARWIRYNSNFRRGGKWTGHWTRPFPNKVGVCYCQ